jgi:hypothetical protein
MDTLNYNASHAADPAAGKAIRAADQQPQKIDDLIQGFKLSCRAAGVRVRGRIALEDKETGRIWR